MNENQVQELSERLVDMLMSDDRELNKTAKQELDDYTRTHNREGSFTPKIIEPSDFVRSKLVPQMHTDQAVMLFEYEATSPFAAPVDYGATPADFIPRGRRYPVVFSKVETRKTVYDLLELQTYGQDVRQIMGDNKTKDLIALRDYRFINSCRRLLGPVGTVLPWAGKAMHVDMASPMSFSAFSRAANTVRDTPFNIEPSKVLMNNRRKPDFEVMAVEEFQGTDMSVDLAVNGWAGAKLNGMQIMMTTKSKLIPTSDTFWFGPQENLGRYIQWIPPTMALEKKETIIEFYIYEVFGLTIAHPGALGINKFIG